MFRVFHPQRSPRARAFKGASALLHDLGRKTRANDKRIYRISLPSCGRVAAYLTRPFEQKRAIDQACAKNRASDHFLQEEFFGQRIFQAFHELVPRGEIPQRNFLAGKIPLAKNDRSLYFVQRLRQSGGRAIT